MVLYDYAHDENEQLIHISSIVKEDRRKHKYTCLCCHDELRPRLGAVRERHFYHTNNACSYESYIHKLGKELFHREYSKCLEEGVPFYVEIPQRTICAKSSFCRFHTTDCVFNEHIRLIDLTKYFRIISMPETADGEFIPDLFIENKKRDKIYIEIFFTSKCSNKKIESGTKIIEIKAEGRHNLSSKEVNLANSNLEPEKRFIAELLGHHFTTERIKCYNFKDKAITPINNNCGVKIKAMLLFGSGKHHVDTYSAIEYIQRRVSKKEVYCGAAIMDNSTVRFLEDEKFAALCLEDAHECGIKVAHCKLCKHCSHYYNNHGRMQYRCDALGKSRFDEKMYIYFKCKEYEADDRKIAYFQSLRNNPTITFLRGMGDIPASAIASHGTTLFASQFCRD